MTNTNQFNNQKVAELKILNDFINLEESIVPWATHESMVRLLRQKSEQLRCFQNLVSCFEPQQDKFMCGPSTIAMILNSIEKSKLFTRAKAITTSDLPIDKFAEKFARLQNRGLEKNFNASFKRFTQKNIFNQNCSKVKKLKELYSPPFGLCLEEIEKIINALSYKAQRFHAVPSLDINFYRNIFKKSLSSDSQYIILNYDQRALGQLDGGGHIAPVAAYDETTDSVLIIDVNPELGWSWIALSSLCKAMATEDKRKPRGFVLVS